MSRKKQKKKWGAPQKPILRDEAVTYDLKPNMARISQQRGRSQSYEYSEFFSERLNQQNPNAVVGQNIDPKIFSQFNSELLRLEQGKNNSELKLEMTQIVRSSVDEVKKDFDGKLDKYMTNVTFRWIAAVVGSVIAFIAGYVFIHIMPLMNDLKDKDASIEKNLVRVESDVEGNKKEIKKLDSLSNERVFEMRYKSCKKMGSCK